MRVDDFRQAAQAVYRFQFTTSLFANFFHHLHSYQDETWRVAFEEAEVVGALPAVGAAPPPARPTGDDAASVARSPRVLFSRELRVVAPDGTVVHAQHFLPDDDCAAEEVRVLRKADGTGFFMVKPNRGSFGVPFAPGQYRLKLTYRRENRDSDPGSRMLSQAGERADEVVTIDIPLQTQ